MPVTTRSVAAVRASSRKRRSEDDEVDDSKGSKNSQTKKARNAALKSGSKKASPRKTASKKTKTAPKKSVAKSSSVKGKKVTNEEKKQDIGGHKFGAEQDEEEDEEDSEEDAEQKQEMSGGEDDAAQAIDSGADGELKARVYTHAKHPAQVRAAKKRESGVQSALNSSLSPSLPPVLIDSVKKQSKSEGLRWCWLPNVDKIKQPSKSSTGSKIGGVPFITSNHEWPKCDICNKHMRFLFQLSGRDLPEELTGEHLSDTQIVQLFLCRNDPFEDADTDKGSGCVRVIDVAEAGDAVPIQPKLIANAQERKLSGWTRKGDVPDGNEHARYGVPAFGKGDAIQDASFGPVDKDKLSGFPIWPLPVDQYLPCVHCGQEMEFFFQFAPHGLFRSLLIDNGHLHLLQCPNHREHVRIAV